MITPTSTQITAAVAAAHAAVASITSVPLTLFIKETQFESIITNVLIAALNVQEPAPASPDQPLAP